MVDEGVADRLRTHLIAAWGVAELDVANVEQRLEPDAIRRQLIELSDQHAAAASGGDPAAARSAYTNIVDQGSVLLAYLDPSVRALDRAQVLLYLHDAELVLNRADLALAHAHEAVAVLEHDGPGRADAQGHGERDRLQVLAAKAVIVALNNLELGDRSLEYAFRLEGLKGFRTNLAEWLPYVATDKLTALRKTQRFTVRDARRIHDQAKRRAPNGHAQVMLDDRLAKVLLQYAQRRGRASPHKGALREARPLIDRCQRAAESGTDLGLVHQTTIWRTVAGFGWVSGDRERWADAVRRCFLLTEAAGLSHERAQLERSYGRVIIDLVFH